LDHPIKNELDGALACNGGLQRGFWWGTHLKYLGKKIDNIEVGLKEIGWEAIDWTN
jgi:hypothetical protein